MSDLRRWSEEGATSEELALLSASKEERPDPVARRRAIQALGAATVLTASATATAAGLLVKIVGVGVIVGGLAAGAVVAHRLGSRASAIPTAASAVPAESLAGGAGNGELPSIEVAPDSSARGIGVPPIVTGDGDAGPPPPSDTATTAAPVSASPAPPDAPRLPARAGRPDASASLTQEVRALERAQELAGRDPNGALRELDRYHARFPGGALSAEETVLRVQAFLARGDEAKARTLADAFSAAHPESPWARRVQDLVRAKKK